MFALFLALAGPAQAGDYLCDLSQSDVEDVINYYDLPGTFQDYAPYVATPFDCSTYGELCEDLGQVRAEQFVCARWADGVDHESVSYIDGEANHDYDTLNDEWEDELFPNGIPGNDAWFGVTGTTSCDKTEYSESGNYRVAVRARYYATGFYNQIKVYTKSYQQNSGGRWKFKDTGHVSIDAYFDSYDAYGVCDVWDPAVKTDTDGRVGRRDYTLGLAWPNENVDGVGQYSTSGGTLSVEACNTAWWNHC